MNEDKMKIAVYKMIIALKQEIDQLKPRKIEDPSDVKITKDNLDEALIILREVLDEEKQREKISGTLPKSNEGFDEWIDRLAK